MKLWAGLTDVLNVWLKNPTVTISVPIQSTGYTKEPKMPPDVISLIDAVCDVYDNHAYLPTAEGLTFCNLATTAVAVSVGCKDFYGKTADEMIAFMASNQEWSEVPFEKAQDLANKGTLVIAGLDSKSLKQEHGHVAIVRPGKPCYSGKWGLTPRVMNVGAENFLARAKKGPLTNQPAGLNESFVDKPKIWAWRQSL